MDREVDNWRVEITYGVAGTFPDFSIYDNESRPVARIEAKRPNESLGQIRANYQDQLRKYLDVQRSGHPNLYITNFLSFRRVVIGNNEVEFSGDATELFGNQQELIAFDITNHQNLAALTGRFRALIQEIIQLEAQDVITPASMINFLGQVMWSSGAWIKFATSDQSIDIISDANRQVATNIETNATNLIVRTGDGVVEVYRSALIGQLFAVGLIVQEINARRAEDALGDEDDWGTELERMIRRQITTDIFPSTRLSRIVRDMYSYRNEMGIGPIVEAAQRSLMMHAPPNIVEFRGLENFLIRFMENEFENWMEDYGFVPTPDEAISYMISRSNETLRIFHEEGSISEHGILSDECHILDPATGGGHFYIQVLRRIYDMSRHNNDSPQTARARVIRAIGNEIHDGRVHAIDIQPMCVILTQIHLAEFCNEIGITFDNLEPQIYLGDSLRERTMNDYNDTPYEETMFGDKHLIIGNPPWGGFRDAEAITVNTDHVDLLLNPWREVFTPIMQALTGNEQVKTANREISYAFFVKYLRKNYQPVVSFLMPMTMTWSAQWVGARQWFLENGNLRIDNLGGSLNPVNRNDGENIFLRVNNSPVGTGNAIYTFYHCEENRGVSALDLWTIPTEVPATDEEPAHEVLTISRVHKLQKLCEWGEL